jgi:(S)-2-hydroxyglutarate dehydrogenase
MKKNVAFVGGGILDLAIGYKLSLFNKKCSIYAFEKETELGCHKTGRISGLLHCGLNYNPNTLKAQFAKKSIGKISIHKNKINNA